MFLKGRIRRLLMAAFVGSICCILASSADAETIARCGDGWLEKIEGYPVLHLKGTPYEMGYQHGVLLKDHVRENMHNILDVKGGAPVKAGPLTLKPRWAMDAIVM